MDGKRSAEQIGKAFAYDCEHLRPRKAADITSDDIADIIAAVSERAPIQSNRLCAYRYNILHSQYTNTHQSLKGKRKKLKAPKSQSAGMGPKSSPQKNPGQAASETNKVAEV